MSFCITIFLCAPPEILTSASASPSVGLWFFSLTLAPLRSVRSIVPGELDRDRDLDRDRERRPRFLSFFIFDNISEIFRAAESAWFGLAEL